MVLKEIDDEINTPPTLCSFITNRHFWNIKHSARVSEREGIKKDRVQKIN